MYFATSWLVADNVVAHRNLEFFRGGEDRLGVKEAGYEIRRQRDSVLDLGVFFRV